MTRHLRKHCRPLHGLRLDKVDRRAVAARITTLAAKSGPVAANRVAASLSAFFNWAIREGLASSNPAAGLNRQPERSRKRVLNDGELKAIWAATDDASDYSAVVRLLMCSGQRAAEIAGLRWSGNARTTASSCRPSASRTTASISFPSPPPCAPSSTPARAAPAAT